MEIWHIPEHLGVDLFESGDFLFLLRDRIYLIIGGYYPVFSLLELFSLRQADVVDQGAEKTGMG